MATAKKKTTASRSKTAKPPASKPAEPGDDKDDAEAQAADASEDTQTEDAPEQTEAGDGSVDLDELRAQIREEVSEELREEIKAEIMGEVQGLIDAAKSGFAPTVTTAEPKRKGPFIKRVVRDKRGFRIKRGDQKRYFHSGVVIEVTEDELASSQRLREGTWPWDGKQREGEELSLEEARDLVKSYAKE